MKAYVQDVLGRFLALNMESGFAQNVMEFGKTENSEKVKKSKLTMPEFLAKQLKSEKFA